MENEPKCCHNNTVNDAHIPLIFKPEAYLREFRKPDPVLRLAQA